MALLELALSSIACHMVLCAPGRQSGSELRLHRRPEDVSLWIASACGPDCRAESSSSALGIHCRSYSREEGSSLGEFRIEI